MAENENSFLTANDIYVEVEGESGKSLSLEEDQQNNLVGIVKGRYYNAEEKRDLDERRWLRAYENYRGLYSKSVKFRDSGRFCRNTKLASNSVRVVYVLGLSEAPANDSQKVLEKLNIASLGQTTEFGEMMAPKNDPSFVGAGNRGIMFGGWSPNSPAFVNVIEMVNITTTGDGVDFGDYNIVAAQVASTSDCHGGVGGY